MADSDLSSELEELITQPAPVAQPARKRKRTKTKAPSKTSKDCPPSQTASQHKAELRRHHALEKQFDKAKKAKSHLVSSGLVAGHSSQTEFAASDLQPTTA